MSKTEKVGLVFHEKLAPRPFASIHRISALESVTRILIALRALFEQKRDTEVQSPSTSPLSTKEEAERALLDIAKNGFRVGINSVTHHDNLQLSEILLTGISGVSIKDKNKNVFYEHYQRRIAYLHKVATRVSPTPQAFTSSPSPLSTKTNPITTTLGILGEPMQLIISRHKVDEDIIAHVVIAAATRKQLDLGNINNPSQSSQSVEVRNWASITAATILEQTWLRQYIAAPNT